MTRTLDYGNAMLDEIQKVLTSAEHFTFVRPNSALSVLRHNYGKEFVDTLMMVITEFKMCHNESMAIGGCAWLPMHALDEQFAFKLARVREENGPQFIWDIQAALNEGSYFGAFTGGHTMDVEALVRFAHATIRSDEKRTYGGIYEDAMKYYSDNALERRRFMSWIRTTLRGLGPDAPGLFLTAMVENIDRLIMDDDDWFDDFIGKFGEK